LNRVNGFLIIDKPAGWTSHDVVSKLRRITGEQQIGHLGTLDPLATGVLPLLIGKWTRLAQYFGKMDKSYTGTIRFGFATDSYDADGERVGEAVPVVFTQERLAEAVSTFAGEIEQMPPAYSAKKIAGKAAYSLARAGKEPLLKAVPITVHCFEVAAIRAGSECAEFSCSLSAGGYVRSLAHELGQRLGCGAHLASLRRTAAGPFTIDCAWTLDELAKLAESGRLAEAMPHPRTLLPELPATTADTLSAGRVRNGGAVNLPEYSSAELVKIFEGRDDLLGIGRRIAGTLFQPVVVLG
jgi:tRNA pseudouridine55 synthase